MKKILIVTLIFSFCIFPVYAKESIVDYKHSDDSVTRVRYTTNQNHTTVTTQKYSPGEYQEQQKKDAWGALFVLILKAIFSPSKK